MNACNRDEISKLHCSQVSVVYPSNTMLLGNLFRVWLKTQVIHKVGGFIAQYYGAGKTFPFYLIWTGWTEWHCFKQSRTYRILIQKDYVYAVCCQSLSARCTEGCELHLEFAIFSNFIEDVSKVCTSTLICCGQLELPPLLILCCRCFLTSLQT
jgi:hypothetical protein